MLGGTWFGIIIKAIRVRVFIRICFDKDSHLFNSRFGVVSNIFSGKKLRFYFNGWYDLKVIGLQYSMFTCVLANFCIGLGINVNLLMWHCLGWNGSQSGWHFQLLVACVAQMIAFDLELGWLCPLCSHNCFAMKGYSTCFFEWIFH